MTAYVFPGCLDGSWTPAEIALEQADLYEFACAATGTDPFVRAYEDVCFSEPALVALSLTRWRRIIEAASPTTFVGCSGGELAALAAAGAISELDAIWLAAIRGRLMSLVLSERPLAAIAACDVTPTAGRQLALAHGLTVASDDAPAEMVFSGRTPLVEVARRTAGRLGVSVCQVPAYRAVPIREFSAVRRSWREALDAADVKPPKLPVFSPTTVRLTIDPRAVLVDGITSCVRIRQTVNALSRHGVRDVCRVGTMPEARPSTATSSPASIRTAALRGPSMFVSPSPQEG